MTPKAMFTIRKTINQRSCFVRNFYGFFKNGRRCRERALLLLVNYKYLMKRTQLISLRFRYEKVSLEMFLRLLFIDLFSWACTHECADRTPAFGCKADHFAHTEFFVF